MDTRDEAEFEQFVAGCGRSLRRTAYLMCGDWSRAEDATQDALVKIYLAWSRVARYDGLRTYAHRAVATAVIDQSRRPWRREVGSADLVAPAPDALGAVDRRVATMAALATLPSRRRACVVLRYFVDLSVEDTAAALEIEVGAVKSQTARALEQLRLWFERTGLTLELEEWA
ncbi:MAG: SigE family RNA polymerase sigma factor [Nocardioides sp.]